MIKFSGVDRIYDSYSWRITRRAKEVWRSGNVISSRHVKGSFLDKFETAVAKFAALAIVQAEEQRCIAAASSRATWQCAVQ